MNDGFEWDITPVNLQFKLWSPKKYDYDYPFYTFTAPSDFEYDGTITEFDWTNDGPDGTYLIGLGSGRHKVGRVWSDIDTVLEFGRYDLVYDYGEIQDRDVILRKLKDQNDLWPQKKLMLTLWNPEFLDQANFYTGGRPRDLIGGSIKVVRAFEPLWTVNAYFQINAIKWRIDASTNESVDLELMMIYEPEFGSSGGGFENQ